MAHSGRFRPKNPSKYKGDPTKIIYRSMWEFKFFRYVDIHPDVIWWQSEEVVVPYMSPIDGRRHRYYPDVIVNKKIGDGKSATVSVTVDKNNSLAAGANNLDLDITGDGDSSGHGITLDTKGKGNTIAVDQSGVYDNIVDLTTVGDNADIDITQSD